MNVWVVRTESVFSSAKLFNPNLGSFVSKKYGLC